MYLGNNYHLTYCTNIHPGESWESVFDSLKKNILDIKKDISPDSPFGIGLRLSDLASRELMDGNKLLLFKKWLNENDLYVFTMNGFPYGGFHGQVVKDAVHKPDWTSKERVDYTIRLCNILAELLPEGIEGGISTSPLSYKPWFADNERAKEFTWSIGCRNLIQVISAMDIIYQTSGKIIHLDMEPEPDGLIENTKETIDFFVNRLLPAGRVALNKVIISSTENEIQNTHTDEDVSDEIIRRHFRVCYDVCHFAIEFEKPADVFAELEKAGIQIGKIQISAALKADLSKSRSEILKELSPFVESTYLHQVIEQDAGGKLIRYNDLPKALETIYSSKGREWRTHFHVPLFISRYGELESTQSEIIEVLDLLKNKQICSHLEIETYTWEVLPEELKLDLKESILRELRWVKERLV